MNTEAANGRSLAGIVAEMKSELKEFVETRVELFKSEAKERLKTLKIAAPLAAFGILLLSTAYLLFTMAVVGLVVAFFSQNPYRWFFAFLAVAILWSFFGGVAAYFAKREFEFKRLLPRKTIEVLKEDTMWIRAEAKNQV
jgi:uncharacterized membrane protein YqjE